MRGRSYSVFTLIVVAALVAPSSAFAHGLHGEAQTIPEFVWLGIRHMVGGWDHLLFIAGIVILARNSLRRAAKLISLFVLGHSLTLLVATLARWQIKPNAVDALVALSVAYIGLRILRGQPTRWRLTGATIFAFGLAHGLGLSTRLQEITLPAGDALVARILAFNIGVEIGQLTALAALVALGVLFTGATRNRQAFETTARGAALALVAVGLIAAAILSFSAIRPEQAIADPGVPAAQAQCRQVDYTPEPALGGGHPDRAFYPPGQGPPRQDLSHILLDGYVIVIYRRNVSQGAQNALATWATETGGIVAAPATPAMPHEAEAFTSRYRLSCQKLSIEALTNFRQDWIDAGRS